MLALLTSIFLAATPCTAEAPDTVSTLVGQVANATASSDPIDCDAIESFTDATGDSAMDYFTKSSYDLDGGFARMLEQVRTAVSSWYFTDRTERMTIEELNTLAEGLQLSTRTGPNGEVFQVVNLGFGGGNSATYFFKNETKTLAPFIIVDGLDCYDRGETAEFLHDTLAQRALMRALRNDHSGPEDRITGLHMGVISYADARVIEKAVRDQINDRIDTLPEMRRIVREARYNLGEDDRAHQLLEDLDKELKDLVVADFTEDMPLPQSWTPDYEIRSGTVVNGNGKLMLIGVSGVSPQDKAMIGRALGPVWSQVLQHRATRAEPDRADLGYQNGGNGILRVGPHTVDGSDYTVVDYVDIDDGSFTLYMAPSPTNPNKLVLTHIQFNN